MDYAKMQPKLSNEETINGLQSAREVDRVSREGKAAGSGELETKCDESTNNLSLDSPLPLEIREILFEFTLTGLCSSLPWDSEKAVKVSSPYTSNDQRQGKSVLRDSSSRPNGMSNGVSAKHRTIDEESRVRRNFETRKRPLSLSSSSLPPLGNWGMLETAMTRKPGSERNKTILSGLESEDASLTCNSETSWARKEHFSRESNGELSSRIASAAGVAALKNGSSFDSLKNVLKAALRLVLDHYYQHRGGYKLSPAERRSHSVALSASEAETFIPPTIETAPRSVYLKRRERLVEMLGGHGGQLGKGKKQFLNRGPPFTVQRIAEVLVSPERFYTQTHKLCNCLEKLLLITTSSEAFGGNQGGETTQSQLEEMELAALANERGRLQSEFRQRRLKRRTPYSTLDSGESEKQTSNRSESQNFSPLTSSVNGVEAAGVIDEDSLTGLSDSGDSAKRQKLEAAARASLRSKFDHVGIDPHSVAASARDVHTIAENRGMTGSPPPPGHPMVSHSAALPLSGHGSMMRPLAHSDHDHNLFSARPLSPMLFHSASDGPPSPPSLSANSINARGPNISNLHPGASPFELRLSSHSDVGRHSQFGSSADTLRDTDFESRSSASSDVDSESDDVSFDDSASDRSDGSDYEPLSAARAMALNRLQQHHRIRVLTLMNPSDGSRPSAYSDYQSGDGVGSMHAEDSGGSDSPSSDAAD